MTTFINIYQYPQHKRYADTSTQMLSIKKSTTYKKHMNDS